jgi:DsbC/DsbD-like thiol-disulfide interchange protein
MMRAILSLRGPARLVAAALLLGAVALVAGHGPSAEAGGKKKSYVKLSATATKPDDDGRQEVTITMEIEKPWYAYANPVGLEDLENAQTKVKLSAKGKLEDVKVEYPAGKVKVDGTSKYNIYEDKVAIKAKVRRARDDASPLTVTVTYMTCNPKGVCLPPETVKLMVP